MELSLLPPLAAPLPQRGVRNGKVENSLYGDRDQTQLSSFSGLRSRVISSVVTVRGSLPS